MFMDRFFKKNLRFDTPHIEKREDHQSPFKKFTVLFLVTKPIKISEFPSNQEERFVGLTEGH